MILARFESTIWSWTTLRLKTRFVMRRSGCISESLSCYRVAERYDDSTRVYVLWWGPMPKVIHQISSLPRTTEKVCVRKTLSAFDYRCCTLYIYQKRDNVGYEMDDLKWRISWLIGLQFILWLQRNEKKCDKKGKEGPNWRYRDLPTWNVRWECQKALYILNT